MQTLWQDLRYGVRMLMKQPGFTLIAVVTLALGIGANTTIFSVINSLLLKPVPFPEAERLALVWKSQVTDPNDRNIISAPNFWDMQRENNVFEKMAILDSAGKGYNLAGEGEPERVSGVRVTDAVTKQSTEYTAKIFFVCASTLNSTWLLMRSARDIWPGGLGSSSGELGHNLMDHHFRLGASGDLEGLDDQYYYGRRPTGFYIPRFRNIGSDKREYLRGFGYQGSASREGWDRAVAELGVGGAFKDAMAQPGQWTIGATAFGEMLPDHKNMISLDETKKDKWGLPVLKIDCAIGENERKMRKDMTADMAEMLEASGVKNVRTYDGGYWPGMGIHEMGTARMGTDAKNSVLNKNNQVWDAPNVFVTDGACMTSAACVNPSLTYMALTARAAAFAVEALNKREL